LSSVWKKKDGKWRALIRRNHQSISKVFLTKGSATAWGKETERKLEKEQYEDFRDSATERPLLNLIFIYLF